MVEGPAGIGKTVLLAAARNEAGESGFRVLRARGAELEREFPFGVVRQLVEPLVAAASQEERARCWTGLRRWRLDSWAWPAWTTSHLGGRRSAPDPSFAVLHGLYWLCANLAAERPLALVVDDAHWADGASLRFLAFLLPRLEELAAAVLLGARPAEAGQSHELLAALTMDPATEVVSLAPLTTSGVATLVATGLGVEPEPAFAAACWEATGGTPFLVRTLVEALRDEGIAPVAASAAKVQNLATATLGRWAMLRLARLGPDAAELAQAVAVLERAELEEAARLAGLASLNGARAAQLLVRAGVLDQAPLCFAHPLLRGAVYREIAVSEPGRSSQACRPAAGRSPRQTRPEWPSTCSPPPPQGTPGWSSSCEPPPGRRWRRGAPESATAYLRRALTEPPPPEAEADLLARARRSRDQRRPAGLASTISKRRWRRPATTRTRTAAGLLFANGLRLHNGPAEAIEVCDRVLARLDRRRRRGLSDVGGHGGLVWTAP